MTRNVIRVVAQFLNLCHKHLCWWTPPLPHTNFNVTIALEIPSSLSVKYFILKSFRGIFYLNCIYAASLSILISRSPTPVTVAHSLSPIAHYWCASPYLSAHSRITDRWSPPPSIHQLFSLIQSKSICRVPNCSSPHMMPELVSLQAENSNEDHMGHQWSSL